MDIVIVGARGLGIELVGYLHESSEYNIVALLDERSGDDLFGYPVIHPEEYHGNCRTALLAVGYPVDKRMVIEKFSHLELTWHTYIHPSAKVSPFAKLGKGCIVTPYAVIAGNAEVGSFVFVNSHCAVGHDALIGDYCSLMPHSSVAGGANLGANCLLSIGAKILPGKTVGKDCRISAGTVVNRNVKEGSLVFGNPIKIQPDIMMLRKKKK